MFASGDKLKRTCPLLRSRRSAGDASYAAVSSAVAVDPASLLQSGTFTMCRTCSAHHDQLQHHCALVGYGPRSPRISRRSSADGGLLQMSYVKRKERTHSTASRAPERRLGCVWVRSRLAESFTGCCILCSRLALLFALRSLAIEACLRLTTDAPLSPLSQVLERIGAVAAEREGSSANAGRQRVIGTSGRSGTGGEGRSQEGQVI